MLRKTRTWHSRTEAMVERRQQMRRRNCIMDLVCSRRDTKPWPGFYSRTFTPHHWLFSLSLFLSLHPSLFSYSSPSILLLSSCFCFSLPYFIPRVSSLLHFSLAIFLPSLSDRFYLLSLPFSVLYLATYSLSLFLLVNVNLISHLE